MHTASLERLVHLVFVLSACLAPRMMNVQTERSAILECVNPPLLFVLSTATAVSTRLVSQGHANLPQEAVALWTTIAAAAKSVYRVLANPQLEGIVPSTPTVAPTRLASDETCVSGTCQPAAGGDCSVDAD
ncbi:hypothetical protein B0J13DRAFT_549695, partial [Dactylonectria estremocensis]